MKTIGYCFYNNREQNNRYNGKYFGQKSVLFPPPLVTKQCISSLIFEARETKFWRSGVLKSSEGYQCWEDQGKSGKNQGKNINVRQKREEQGRIREIDQYQENYTAFSKSIGKN